MALKAGKPVILLAADEIDRVFFERLGKDTVKFATSAADAVAAARPFRKLPREVGEPNELPDAVVLLGRPFGL